MTFVLSICDRCIKTGFLSQWLAGTGVTLLLIQLGALTSWSSPYIARLISPNSAIPIDLDQASWVVSLMNLGRLFGAIPGAAFVYCWGGRNGMIMSLMFLSLSWVCMILADSASYLYVSRLLGGVGTEFALNSFPVFVGEVASPKYRGAMIVVGFCGSSFSATLVSFIGSFLSLDTFGICFLVPSLVAILIFLIIYESPHHLVKNKKFIAGRKSLIWYRNSYLVDKEFTEVKSYVAYSNAKTVEEKLREFELPHVRRALILVLVLFAYMQGTGLNTLLFNTESVLIRARFRLIKPSDMVVYMTIAGSVALLISSFFIDRCGRRILMILSSFGGSVAMAMLGTHFLLINQNHDPEDLQFLPMISLFLYHPMYVIGFMSVPSTVLSEVFPANLKSIAICIVSLSNSLIAFITAKSYQPLVDLIGDTWVFYIHALLILTAIPYVIIFMPETKGKSLQRIQEDQR